MVSFDNTTPHGSTGPIGIPPPGHDAHGPRRAAHRAHARGGGDGDGAPGPRRRRDRARLSLVSLRVRTYFVLTVQLYLNQIELNNHYYYSFFAILFIFSALTFLADVV